METRSLRQTRIEIGFGEGVIDGIMCGPEEMRPPMPGVVVAHPHPLLGGNADHPVVYAICRELAELGIMSLRFNFTVGTQDTESLLTSAARELVHATQAIGQWDFVSKKRIGVAGFSFGAASILRTLPELDNVAAVSLLAPPVNAVTRSTLGEMSRPRQVVVGTADKLVNPTELEGVIRQLDDTIQFETIPDADHNFSYTSDEVAKTAALFLAEQLTR
jgi:alpha/beta superfamily hydrolase